MKIMPLWIRNLYGPVFCNLLIYDNTITAMTIKGEIQKVDIYGKHKSDIVFNLQNKNKKLLTYCALSI